MNQPKPLSARARIAAANCLGVTPHDRPDQILAALALALSSRSELDDITVHQMPLDSDDPIRNRQVAAAQLLLTSPSHQFHMRRASRFVFTDARVPEPQRQFQDPGPDAGAPARQGSLFRTPAPDVPVNNR